MLRVCSALQDVRNYLLRSLSVDDENLLHNVRKLDLVKIGPIRKPTPNPPENLGFEHDFYDPNTKYTKPAKPAN